MEWALTLVFVLYCILGYDKSKGGVLPQASKDSIGDILVWVMAAVVLFAFL